MSKVMVTVLKSASGGFGEYDWVESNVATNQYGEECETFSQYETSLDEAEVEYEVTDELSGRIHNEQGRVYKCTENFTHPDGSQAVTYIMAWEEVA